MGFKIGVELEGCYNRPILERIAPKLKDYYEIHHDGSLRSSRLYNEETLRELVTKVKKNKRGFFNALELLKKTSNEELRNNALREELNNFVDFNVSCGSHVHFSYDNMSFKHIEIKRLYALRRRFFKKLQESNIKAKHSIKSHYYRTYATQINKKKNWFTAKYSEFNLTSENRGNGFEWRSLNLLGVDTWADFFEFFNLVYSCLTWFEKYLNKCYNENIEITIKINQNTLKKVLEKLIIEELNNLEGGG